MRHRDGRQRLTQKPGHARMLKRNLVTSLLLYESVRTTKSRARAVAPMVDRLITIAKKKEPHVAIRAINRVVTDKNASRKILEVFTKRYAKRDSGMTSIKALGARQGDGAHLVQISLVDRDMEVEVPQKAEPKKEAKKASNTADKAAKAEKKEETAKAEATEKKPAAKKPAAKKATPKKES